MHKLEAIAERIQQDFGKQTAIRDQALKQCRTLTRHSAHAIRAVHRNERDTAQQQLDSARKLAETLRIDLAPYPALYFAGYTQDALKEFVEAQITFSLIGGGELPTPEDLAVESNTYLKGLAETVGELRRRCLDILRHGYSQEAEQLLTYMDEIYSVLVTMDYPDAVTNGLRRLTDGVRAVTERTRGDLTLTFRQQQLADTLHRLENGFSA